MATYWNHNGKHQQDYDELSEALVPDIGKAQTFLGEALRCIGNLAYDFYNNGGANARKDWLEPNEVEPEDRLNEFYEGQLDFLGSIDLPDETFLAIRRALNTGEADHVDSDTENDCFDDATDWILESLSRPAIPQRSGLQEKGGEQQ